MYVNDVSRRHTSDVEDRVSRALETSPYLSKRYRLDVTENEGRVTLDGTVRTFFQKQMAQELLRTVDGVRQINNQLKVVWG